MKNADMPAMPVLNGDNEPANMVSKHYSDKNLAVGLTKREVMAMHMMQGIISRGVSALSSKGVAMDAVVMADALLSELEKHP